MRRHFLALAVLGWVAASAIGAQALPELFGKAKEEIKAKSWEDALKTLDALEAEAAKPGNEGAQKQLAGALAFYRGVCNAELGRKDDAAASFAEFLKLQPGATIDAAVYSKKSVAAFEKAQKTAAERAASLAEAYKEFQPPADAKDRYPSDQYWAEGAVRWIMTADEKARWAGLTDPNARVAFVDEFWTARAALPVVGGRTFREEFERRVAFADENLAVDPEQRGSLTDRGMVFVLLGPPTWAGRKPIRTGEDTNDNAGMSTVGSQDESNALKGTKATGGRNLTSGKLAVQSAKFGSPSRNALDSNNNQMEVWHYRRELLPSAVPYQQVDFQFVTRKGYGIQVLQRDTEPVNTLDAAKTSRPKS